MNRILDPETWDRLDADQQWCLIASKQFADEPTWLNAQIAIMAAIVIINRTPLSYNERKVELDKIIRGIQGRMKGN
jgi:hypothetical protein